MNLSFVLLLFLFREHLQQIVKYANGEIFTKKIIFQPHITFLNCLSDFFVLGNLNDYFSCFSIKLSIKDLLLFLLFFVDGHCWKSLIGFNRVFITKTRQKFNNSKANKNFMQCKILYFLKIY